MSGAKVRARHVLAAVALVGASLAGAPVAADGLAGLASHRAVYEMSLGAHADRAEVTSVEGRLVYEFSGSKCEGWTSRFRLVTRLGLMTGGGDPEKQASASRLTDLRTSSYEDPDGKTFDFLNQNYIDDRMVEDTKGLARHEDGRTTVRLDRPAAKSVDLPSRVKFPTEHLAAIVAAARAGRTLEEIDLYDGSESGEKTYRTTVVIGREQTGDDDTTTEPAAASDIVKGKRRWPVDVSYFDPAKIATGEATPDYQMSFLLYENGISRKMRLNYGEFSLQGTLSALTALPTSSCP